MDVVRLTRDIRGTSDHRIGGIKLPRRCEFLRWTTAANLELLLPPRQSRGTSPVG